MKLIFLHGPPASGKLTVAKALHERTGLPLFHNHLAVDVALRFFDFGTEGFVRMREGIWLTVFREALREGRSFIFTFHPEASVPEGFVGEVVEMVEEGGGKVVFVELTCPEEVILSRLATKERAAYGKLQSAELYKQLEAQGAFAYPPLPEPAVLIDTSKTEPQEAAEHIESVLGS